MTTSVEDQEARENAERAILMKAGLVMIAVGGFLALDLWMSAETTNSTNDWCCVAFLVWVGIVAVVEPFRRHAAET
jgi:hypothetical protein